MLIVISGLRGASVEAGDGWVGTVKDLLFDDQTWRIRWIVVDTGTWLPGRKVLIHPSAVAPVDIAPPSGAGLPMMRGRQALVLPVLLTKQQIEAGPETREDEPVTKQIESRVYDYYSWDPGWGTSYVSIGTIAAPLSRAGDVQTHPGEGDPHLRSVSAVDGYHTHATDGDIGHVENFIADDVNWDIRYLVVATSNWWPGKHVLLAPYAVQTIDQTNQHIRLNVTRGQVESSPPWDPIAMIDQINERRLHTHYGWPGYGW
jgi:hypothetical protein